MSSVRECPHQKGVTCGWQECETCGWNPRVAKERADKVREKLKGERPKKRETWLIGKGPFPEKMS